jgi:hypothetical protein
MCKLIKVAYACSHLGRVTGTKRCEHVQLMKEWGEAGIIPKTLYLYQYCKDTSNKEKESKEEVYEDKNDDCPRCKESKESRQRVEVKEKAKIKTQEEKEERAE